MPRALFSVYDKTDLTRFASELIQIGWDLVASGGTEKALRESGLPVTPVEQLTGLPHMLGGRVKTLHPAIHAGILARNTSEDLDTLARHGYAPIAMVVCNLYPFQETVARQSATLQDAIEQIDIGGVTLLRAAAKNFFHSTVVCDPQDYTSVIASLKAAGEVELAMRRNLAIKAFALTRDYDTAIHAFLSIGTTSLMSAITDVLPGQISLGVQKVETLKYGENPHQEAAYYSRQSTDGPFGGSVISGAKLSYTNIRDIDVVWRVLSSFTEATVVVVKHTNPLAIASGDSTIEALVKIQAQVSDVLTGCVIGINRPLSKDFIEYLGTIRVDAIAAPSVDVQAQDNLLQYRPNCHVVQIPHPFDGSELEIRSVHKGILVQRPDVGDPEGSIFKTVTIRVPSESEMFALQFAWNAVRHVRTSGIVIAQQDRTIAIAGGLTDCLESVRSARESAQKQAVGAVIASDSFLPTGDAVRIAAEAGITAIIQPGGSIRDSEGIDVANKANIAMVFTGTRHFNH